jgi:hypothetical protein
MTVILIIICVVVFIWVTNSKKKIDEEEKVALKTPGVATRLREHYGDVLDLILEDENHTILFERSYDESVKIGNSKNQQLFMSYSSLGSHGPELRVACIQDSMVLKEWVFDKRRSAISIYQEIIDYFY